MTTTHAGVDRAETVFVWIRAYAARSLDIVELALITVEA
jgi:hypothetical protein